MSMKLEEIVASNFQIFGSKLDWLKSRGDKKLETDEGQVFLHLMTQLVEDPRAGDKIDALLPWVAREWKKGRIHLAKQWPYLTYGGTEDFAPPGVSERFDLPHVADWFHSKAKSRKGVDIMQLDVDGIMQKVDEWGTELEEKEADEGIRQEGQVLWASDNGWTVRQLTNAAECENEGNAMGHCVGGYGPAVEAGRTQIYSLRDPKGDPHVTFEIEPGHPSFTWASDATQKWQENLGSGLGSHWKDLVEGEIPYEQLMVEAPQHGLQWLANKGFSAKVHEDLVKAGVLIPDGNPVQGDLVQIYGRGNEEPKAEYAQLIKDWNLSMPREERAISGDLLEGWNTDETFDKLEALGNADNVPIGEGDQYGFVGQYNWNTLIDVFHDHVLYMEGSPIDAWDISAVAAGIIKIFPERVEDVLSAFDSIRVELKGNILVDIANDLDVNPQYINDENDLFQEVVDMHQMNPAWWPDEKEQEAMLRREGLDPDEMNAEDIEEKIIEFVNSEIEHEVMYEVGDIYNRKLDETDYNNMNTLMDSIGTAARKSLDQRWAARHKTPAILIDPHAPTFEERLFW